MSTPDSRPPLYMVSMPFYRAAFNEWLRRRGLADPDHAMHILLTEIFGDKVLRPFRLMSSQALNAANLYGYSREDGATIRDHGQLLADPMQLSIFDFNKPFPTKNMAPIQSVPAGARHGFEVRVRPTLRRPHHANEGHAYSRTREHDAYHVYLCDRFPFDHRSGSPHEVKLIRHRAYAAWLARHFDTQKGVQLEPRTFHIISYRQVRSVRDINHQPSIAPELVCRGNLIIQDTQHFLRLIETGVGRHRAYGYGMLMLRQLHPVRGPMPVPKAELPDVDLQPSGNLDPEDED